MPNAYYGWLKPWLGKLCIAAPGFRAYLGEEALYTHHYLAIVNRALAPAGTHHQTKEIALLLRTRSRKQVLRTVMSAHPRGVLSALGKMGPKLRSRSYYDRVLKCLAGSSSAKVLNHAESIPPLLLDGLNEIDPSLHNLRLLGLVNTQQRLRTFLYLNKVLEKVLPAARLLDARTSLLRVESYSGIGEWFDKWLKEGILPAAPWPGTDRLRPMTTCEQLDKAAARFNNCLRTQVPRAVLGTHYFYEWRGREPAIASVVVGPRLGWVIEDIKKIKNRGVRTGTRDAIIRDFSHGGIDWCPFGIDSLDDVSFALSVEDFGEELEMNDCEGEADNQDWDLDEEWWDDDE